jgi:fucose 4-O-acetylase-like acetyltransferase
MQELNNRIVYIDFLKVFLTCMVVAHHAGQAYGNTGGVWLVTDNPKLDYLRPLFFINASFMMGLYFFISGYFSYYSIQKKPIKKFLKERFTRLGIPLVFFSLFVFSPIHYLINDINTNYFEFLIDLHFNHPPLSFGHLWFVAALLIYSIILLLLIKLIYIEIKFSDKFISYYPLLYLLIIIPLNVLVRQVYPIDYWVTWLIPLEVAHQPQYISLFLFGALFNKTKWLELLRPSISFTYLIAGSILYFYKDFITQSLPQLWGESITESFLCVGLCLGFISFFKLTINQMNIVIKFLSDNAYGIYLFHLLIVIVLQILLVELNLNTNIKFILVSIFGILISGYITFLLKKNILFKNIL